MIPLPSSLLAIIFALQRILDLFLVISTISLHQTYHFHRRCSRAILRFRPSSRRLRACSSTQPSERQCSHSGRWDRSSEGGLPEGTYLSSSSLGPTPSRGAEGGESVDGLEGSQGPRRRSSVDTLSSCSNIAWFQLSRLSSSSSESSTSLRITERSGELSVRPRSALKSFLSLPRLRLTNHLSFVVSASSSSQVTATS